MLKERELLIHRDKGVLYNVYKYVRKEGKFCVTFANEKGLKIYSYQEENISLCNGTEIEGVEEKFLSHKGQRLYRVAKAFEFENHVKILFENGRYNAYKKDALIIKDEGEGADRVQKLLRYFRQIAGQVDQPEDVDYDNEKEHGFMNSAFQSLGQPDTCCALYRYLNGTDDMPIEMDDSPLIFPFSFNTSQKIAVTNGLRHSQLIIEGPPGTGKTQTILNLISNIAIMQNKTVGIVAGSNSAVDNVKEKMDKAGYGFLLANLGKMSKRQIFFACPPAILFDDSWNTEESNENLRCSLTELGRQLDGMLEKKIELAQIKQQLRDCQTEQSYFLKYYEKQDVDVVKRLSFYSLPPEKIILFMTQCKLLSGEYQRTFRDKLKLLFRYGFYNFKQMDRSFIDVILQAQTLYYQRKLEQLQQRQGTLEHGLNGNGNISLEKLQSDYQKISEQLFRKKIYERYANWKEVSFGEKNYKNEKDFMKRFPIVLSTAHSLRSCVGEALLDYVIIDEASMVDVLSGVLTLSCCKNIIIVGDSRQLPQISNVKDAKCAMSLRQLEILEPYNYFEQNILSSFQCLYGKGIESCMLLEHYRCHPQIIGFCNRIYYDNRLILLTEEKAGKGKPLSVYFTAPGNHMRTITEGDKKGKYNRRELEVVDKEVLQEFEEYEDEEIGFITAYVKQKEKSKEILPEDIESDTIHKYQGREKPVIIMSTVLDSTKGGNIGKGFVDDPCKVNVAVSRAVERFVLVTDRKCFQKGKGEICSLIEYIQYQTLDMGLQESRIVSIFDLLYKDYDASLRPLWEKLMKDVNPGRYKSEQILETALKELREADYPDIEIVRQVYIKNLFTEFAGLTEEEERYIRNGASVDFVLYSRYNMQPALAMEVDGTAFHENNPLQLDKDKLKDNIFEKQGLRLKRFKTNEMVNRETLEKLLQGLS